MERLLNIGWITGSTINLLQFIKLIDFNEWVLVISGILGIVLLIYQISNKILQRKELKTHIKKEELELSEKRLQLKQARKKFFRDGKASK